MNSGSEKTEQELREELTAIVHLAQRNYKRRSGDKAKLTIDSISQIVGVGRTYISGMLGGTKKVTQKNIDDFRTKLRDYILPMSPQEALLNILMEEIAEYKANNTSDKEKNKDYFINQFKKKVDQKLSDDKSDSQTV